MPAQVRPAELEVTLADFLRAARLPLNETGASWYLEHQELDQTLPRLDALVDVPDYLRFLPLRYINLWAGRGGTISCVHSDSHENVLVQLVGEKEFILFPPSDSQYLAYDDKPGLLMSYTFPGQFEEIRRPKDLRKNIAGIQLHKPLTSDMQLNETTPARCRVKEGDALYVPAYWHHQVESFASTNCSHYPLSNVAINFWFKENMTPDWMKPPQDTK